MRRTRNPHRAEILQIKRWLTVSEAFVRSLKILAIGLSELRDSTIEEEETRNLTHCNVSPAIKFSTEKLKLSDK